MHGDYVFIDEWIFVRRMIYKRRVDPLCFNVKSLFSACKYTASNFDYVRQV